ncbi:TonB-dependent receptor [Methylocystis parvus]|uniref:TonB-dependent receptor n=1 Tax=Methylocystis parvus TaxID=134 RepID=A0A6B8M2G8_9HYPH|nr:TonB-dependent receptor [Methylocystis parvus]QGM96442.1 TonB-dependent receptor [Methylocystis parvus]WBJ99710.1 TonB-dependent receptor [Methylocystis parvus OBBP]
MGCGGIGTGRRLLICVAAGALALNSTAFAQQSLPTIDVGTASPIKRRTPQRVESARAPTPAPPISVSPAQPVAPAVEAPPPGVLAIAPDQFAAVTVVTNEELRASAGATLGDVLFSRPGVTSSSFAPGAASRPIVRGLDNYRVRIQENGVGASGVSEMGEDHGVPLDPLGASQMEVVRGPATLRWGSQAIGGVVNVANNRIPEAPPCALDAAFREKGCAAAETRAAIATVDNLLENAMLLDAGRGNFLVHADAHGRRASDYRVPGYPYLYVDPFAEEPPPYFAGRQPNSSNRSGGASLGGSYLIPSGGFVGFAVTQYDSRYRIPGIEPTETNTRIEMRQTRVTGKGDIHIGSAYVDAIRFWAGLTDYKHHELANEGGFDGVQQTFTNKDLEVRVETQFMPVALPFGVMTSVAGVQGNHQILTSPGLEGGLYDPNRTKSVAAYLFNELRVTDAFRAQLAGRIEHAQVAGSLSNLLVDPAAPISRNLNFTPASGAFGLLHDLPYGLVASLSAQYVERAPRAPELLSRGVHEATGTFDVGNPNLGIERAKTFELGLRRATGPLRFEAALYVTRFDGFIFRNLTGPVCEADFASCAIGGAGDLRLAIYSQRNAVFRGAEFQSQLDVAPLMGGTIGVENQFDVVRASFTSGGNVPRIPPVRLGGGLYWRDANWLMRANLLHAFAQNDVAATGETPTNGYNLLRAELSYRTPLAPNNPWGREMTLGLVGNNLLNADIRNSVSFRKNEVLLPGANLRLFADVRF